MKLQLTGDMVLVEPLNYPRKSKGGLELPSKMQHLEPEYGEVVEVGPGPLTEKGDHLPMPCKKGDRIFYLAVQVYPFLYTGVSCFLIQSPAVVAIVGEDETRGELMTSNERMREACPVHKHDCGLVSAIEDGRQGGYCPLGKKFYRQDELK